MKMMAPKIKFILKIPWIVFFVFAGASNGLPYNRWVEGKFYRKPPHFHGENPWFPNTSIVASQKGELGL